MMKVFRTKEGLMVNLIKLNNIYRVSIYDLHNKSRSQYKGILVLLIVNFTITRESNVYIIFLNVWTFSCICYNIYDYEYHDVLL